MRAKYERSTEAARATITTCSFGRGGSPGSVATTLSNRLVSYRVAGDTRAAHHHSCVGFARRDDRVSLAARACGPLRRACAWTKMAAVRSGGYVTKLALFSPLFSFSALSVSVSPLSESKWALCPLRTRPRRCVSN